MLAATSLSPAQDEKRELSKYDVIGPYKIVKFASGPKTDQLEAEIREFLWTHWRQHRRGPQRAIRTNREAAEVAGGRGDGKLGERETLREGNHPCQQNGQAPHVNPTDRAPSAFRCEFSDRPFWW